MGVFIVVQIPSFNEEASIAAVVGEVPRNMEAAERIEVLVVDDGSTDRSADQARAAGADHVVRFPGNRGLCRAFEAGLDASLELGADIVVNMDADGQYSGKDIPRLVAPIISGEADVVVGDRGIRSNPDYPFLKKSLQVTGSSAVSALSGANIPDAASGFRAFSREAAQRIHLVSEFTYSLESLVQAGADRLKVMSVPVTARPTERPSRLFSSISEYMKKSASTLLRVYSMYQPLKVFSIIGGALFTGGFAIGLWFLYYFLTEGGKGHVQALILAAVLMIIGFQVLVMGLVADLIGSNRKLLRDLLFRVKRLDRELARKKRGNSTQGS